MPRGRPRKRRCHFSRQLEHSRRMESNLVTLNQVEPVGTEQDIQVSSDDVSNNLKPFDKGESSTSNVDDKFSNRTTGISENSFNIDRPVRACKLKCREKISEIRQMDNKQLSESISWQAFQHRAKESVDERHQRLEDLRQRASLRLASEDTAERQQRLEDLRQRASLRLASENPAERHQRLEDIRLRASARLASESINERRHRLVEQNRRQARYEMALQNECPTYKLAVNKDVVYKTLGEFTVECIHCKATHFPGERVSNPLHRDSFGDCCLHGRLLPSMPQFANDLVRLFLHRHPLSKEFHKRIRNLNSCFAFSSFNVAEDRTINSHGIYSFIACGQVYHKMNLAAQPTQNIKGEFEKPQYGQMYFLDPDDAIEERLNHPLNCRISRELMELLEHIIRAYNGYAQGYMMMREVQDEVNQQVITEGLSPPEVKLLFRIPMESDYRRFNAPSTNEVCAVFTLNADQSFPDNEMIVHRRNKEIIVLKNIDRRVEPFTYPLFYPQGTDGFSLDLKLTSPYPSRQHATRLELAQNRLAFRRGEIDYLSPIMDSTGPDLRQINFNALHFGGRLFQQYVVDTFIRVERDRIQWIKANQKKNSS